MKIRIKISSLSVMAVFLFQVQLISGQTSLREINLNNGKYAVGFLHYITSDSTRTYSRIYDYTNNKIPRTIPVSVWYPSHENVDGKEQLRVLNYFEILKEEEEWENLPNEQLLNWFYYANTPSNKEHLKETTTANYNLNFANGKFPVIVYAPSYQASSIENFALCEYLASHGYLIISSPSRGTETRWFSNNNSKEMETQARDVEFLLKEVAKYPTADLDKTAAIGFSFGGLSNVIAQTRNDNIKAVVSLDGTERYQYGLLKKSPFFEIKKIDVPYLHMAQKDIPEEVLQEDKINPVLNTEFTLYDSITNSEAYKLKFHHLTHSYFSTLGVLFAARDTRQDKSDNEIMESYKLVSVYTLNFLDAYLKNDSKAFEFVSNNPADNGIDNDLMTKNQKKPEISKFSFRDFNDLASSQNYKNLMNLYKTNLQANPSLSLPEGNLNTLGLQLVFDPDTSEQGIEVLLLATQLYPNSANLFDSLAEAYLFIEDKEKAIENFEKSLELYPQNPNAINRLQQLNK